MRFFVPILLCLVNALPAAADSIVIDALGRAVYRRSGDTWKREEDFEWRMKKLGPEPSGKHADVAAKLRAKLARPETEAPEKRAETPEEIQEVVAGHLAEHGWTATTGPVAAPHSAELKVALSPLGEGWRMAVQWMQRGAGGELEIATRPDGASVGPDDAIWSLVGGSAPEAVRFAPSDWRPVADAAP